MEILPGVHGVDFDGVVWAYLYRRGPGFILIDCGIAGRLEVLETKLREFGAHLSDIEQLILTHCHEDHAGTAAELQRLTGVTTLAHSLDAPFVRGEAKVPPPRMTEAESRLYAQIAGKVPLAPAARVDCELSGGDKIDVGEQAIVIHSPGHTPGSISLWVPARRLLFTGDAAASTGRPIVAVFNVDPARATESFRRLSELDAETACFGHGPPIGSDAGLLLRAAAEKP
jgi:glyoxylase-like metal-dependent hydrolase (beta-lactamase superfamily II)